MTWYQQAGSGAAAVSEMTLLGSCKKLPAAGLQLLAQMQLSTNRGAGQKDDGLIESGTA